MRVVVRIGADAAIDQCNESVREQSKTLTAGQGPEVVVDPVGGEVAEQVLRSIAWRGRWGGFCVRPDSRPALKPQPANGRFRSLPSSACFGEKHQARAPSPRALNSELLRWQQQGRIEPVIDERRPMHNLPLAFARKSVRHVRDKLLLAND